MSLWESAGYTDNPYSVDPLPPTEEGLGLLVGRDKELQQLLVQLRSTDTHPTIEGDNGVGKTSLVLVAAYQAETDFVQGSSKQLFVPLTEPLQIQTDTAAFERAVSFAILQAYIGSAARLEEFGYFVPDLADIRRWLQQPIIHSGGGGGSALGFGANATHGMTTNATPGFIEAGLRAQLVEWLRQTFPTKGHGGFIAVVDNLELLQTSAEARRVVESIRDGALRLPGIRWVLCGAKGIVRSAASSPRLSGRIGRPIDLRPVPDALVPELVRRRLAHYSARPDPDTPVDPIGFSHLYQISHKNLRNALKHAEDFAVWLYQENLLGRSAEEKSDLLEQWIAEIADEYVRDAVLQEAQWRLFDQIAEAGGAIAPGDHEQFGFNTSQAMRFHLVRLERANLVDSTVDEEDQRRRTIAITSIGWLVRHRRATFQP